jgi:ADP-heptose:LPS heptosyltransferase
MQAKSKIKLDRVVGGFLVFFLNLGARVVSLVLGRSHEISQDQVKTICVAKFAGLGSILCAGPLLGLIKETYPNARLVFISSQHNAELLECMPVVDERLYVSETSLPATLVSSVAVLIRLWRLRPQFYIDLEVYSYYSSMMATLSCARNRIGFYRLSSGLKKGLFTHLVFFNTAVPVQSLYLQLGRVAGCTNSGSPAPVLRVPPTAKEQAESALSEWLPVAAPLLVVNPNASDLLLERRWPIENFSAAITGLFDLIPGLHVALIGSRGEQQYISRLAGLLASHKDRLREYAGLNLAVFLGVLQRANCFLTNDSGPMHMAFDFRVPTVALFGPASPVQFASFADIARRIILYEPVLCSPCVHNVDAPPCGGDNQCMKRIDVPRVVDACYHFLAETPRDGKPPQEWTLPARSPILSSLDGVPLGKVELRGGSH